MHLHETDQNTARQQLPTSADCIAANGGSSRKAAAWTQWSRGSVMAASATHWHHGDTGTQSPPGPGCLRTHKNMGGNKATAPGKLRRTQPPDPEVAAEGTATRRQRRMQQQGDVQASPQLQTLQRPTAGGTRHVRVAHEGSRVQLQEGGSGTTQEHRGNVASRFGLPTTQTETQRRQQGHRTR